MWPGLRRALLNCPSSALLLNGFIVKGEETRVERTRRRRRPSLCLRGARTVPEDEIPESRRRNFRGDRGGGGALASKPLSCVPSDTLVCFSEHQKNGNARKPWSLASEHAPTPT